jgi:hypothetical protein
MYLTLRQEVGHHGTLYRIVKVGIFENYQRRLSAKFQSDVLYSLSQ